MNIKFTGLVGLLPLLLPTTSLGSIQSLAIIEIENFGFFEGDGAGNAVSPLSAGPGGQIVITSIAFESSTTAEIDSLGVVSGISPPSATPLGLDTTQAFIGAGLAPAENTFCLLYTSDAADE